MPMRYAEVSRKEPKFLDLTSLAVEEFQQLLPVFEEEFVDRMKKFRLDGKPRTGRGYQTYSNCPLPTPEDRLLFILVYLKNNPLQVMSGKKKCHAVKNVFFVDRQHKIQYLSETHPGKVHDQRVVDATPDPLPHGSVLLQDLGFLGFTLEGVTIEMPTKKPKGRQLTDEQKAANQAKARRRVCIEHVNSSIKCLRTLKDVCRLLVSGIRDMIIEIGCAFHNFRLRLDPWLPIPEAK